jgi:L-lactate dehydrogenase (cytochrome)
MGTTSIEQLVDAVPAGQKWFQLYVWKDRKASEELMERAAAAGYQALVVTVDSPIPGARLRDVRNGFSMPPTLTLRTVGEMATHPAWWFNLLTTRPPSFSSLDSWGMPLAELLPTLFDPSVTVADLAWIRSRWDGPLVVKGVQSVNDACRVADAGADGVVLSNHGGRQLDRGIAPLELVGPTVAAVRQHATVMVDTGVMSGADVVAAVALGADAVLVGRAYLYGLLAGGEAGVRRALDILSTEIRRTMQFLGARTTEELTPDLVRLGQTWCHCSPDRG